MLSCNNVKNLLLMKDITQSELSEYVGVSKNYISMLMNGVQPFSEDNYNKIIGYINSSEEFRNNFREQIKIKRQEEKNNKNKGDNENGK